MSPQDHLICMEDFKVLLYRYGYHHLSSHDKRRIFDFFDSLKTNAITFNEFVMAVAEKDYPDNRSVW